jgi:hypothetical protein
MLSLNGSWTLTAQAVHLHFKVPMFDQEILNEFLPWTIRIHFEFCQDVLFIVKELPPTL